MRRIQVALSLFLPTSFCRPVSVPPSSGEGRRRICTCYRADVTRECVCARTAHGRLRSPSTADVRQKPVSVAGMSLSWEEEQASSVQGLTAIVIESYDLQPTRMLGGMGAKNKYLQMMMSWKKGLKHLPMLPMLPNLCRDDRRSRARRDATRHLNAWALVICDASD